MSTTKKAEHFDFIPAVCPLTESQLGVYFDCVGKPGSTLYNIPVRILLPPKTDKIRFVRAVKTVASKHKALFVTIGAPGGIPSMLYEEKPVQVTEISANSIKKHTASFCRPFDLENGPLYRFEYVTTPEGDAFFFDVHHIVFDGTSANRFVNQIALVYNGGECPEEELTVFDIAEAEKSRNDVQAEQKYREYFDSKFSEADCNSKPVPDRTEANEYRDWGMIWVDAGNRISAEEVGEYVKNNAVSENALILGAFGYALAKLNGTEYSAFNTAYHGRSDRRLSETVGMFVKTLPFLCRYDENEAPADYLKRVYNDYYMTKKNESISFGKLAEQYGLNTNVSFIYQSELFRNVEFENGSAEVEVIVYDSSVADIEMMLMKTDTGYMARCFYLLSDYTEAFIRSFTDLFIDTMSGMLKASSLKEISLVSGKGLERLEALNRTEQDYDAEKTVVDLFREQAAKAPDSVCLSCKGKNYTYREVDEYTDSLAKYLVSSGIGREKIAAVLVPRNEYITLCSLAVLKAGGAYLPMDTSYPPERLNLMIQDSGAVVLLTTPELSELIDDSFTGKRLMVLAAADIPQAAVQLPSPKPEDLFCILYTSGSTGTPKGVMYNHSNAAVTTAFVKRFYDMGGSSRIAAYASYGFDANIYDTYPAVTSGAALHIIPDEIRLDLLAVRDYFNENGITHSVMTTQVGRQFALLGGLKTLRHLSVAGEKLSSLDAPNDFKLYNLYGPTEGSVITSGFLIDRTYRDIPIGSAVDNLKLYVVDKIGRLLPTGAVGELWIAGPHVTRGYLNRPEKTAESFGDNPFCTTVGYERVYRTGDIVRLAADGNLQFIGRRDGQVKIRGFRVELNEIREIILRFDGVRDAVVAAFDDPNGGKFLAAYLVADTPIDIEALNSFIRADKPPYMVPAVTMQIEKIPLNQNQKVNRKALPVPKRSTECIAAPETDVQRKIFDIVSDIVGHKDFGVDTDLFDAGLTSIGSLKLNIRLGTEFNTPVRLDDIKQNDTIRKLEAFLSEKEAVTEQEIRSDYPITQTQQGIFVECSAKPNTVTYNMPFLVRLGERVDVSRLVSALKTVINAHPYIKATLFADENGDIRARRNDGAQPQIKETVCECVPGAGELVVPFKLLGEPLYRITVYKTKNGNYLFMDFHHIVSDGVSQAIFLADIDKAYGGKEIPAEKFTGYDTAVDEDNMRHSERLTKAKAYYESVFKGCEADCLPPKAPEHGKSGAASVIRTCRLDADKVTGFCKQNRFTPNAFFNAAFGFTLSRFGNFEDTVFTTIYSGRNDSRLAFSVAMLVKTLPVMVHTDKSRAVSDMISETQQQLLNSMANSIYSFAEISAAYGIRSDIIFAYQGDSFAFNSLCGEQADFLRVLPAVAKAPLSLNVYLKNGKFELDAEYDCARYNRVFIENLLDVFENVLCGFTEKKRTEEIDLLSEAAEQRLNQINNTARAFENIPVNRFVERFAESDPDRTAVIDHNTALTFGELNRLANRMAHVLVRHGVRKDSVVGFMLERTAQLSVTELAIIKAGGAFLGLLPEYPDDRAEYCLVDAESTVVITTEKIKRSRPELFSVSKPYRTLTVEKMLEDGSEDNLNLNISPDSLVYCIYTSGSTGKPKGVMIEHHNLASFAQPSGFPYAFYHGSESGTTSVAISSVSFDMSVIDNLVMLMNGKTVCIASDRDIHNPGLFAELLEKNRVDILGCTPSFLTNMLSFPEFRAVVKQLKTILSGAEAFPASLYSEIKGISPSINVLNGYGPSECTISCCAKLLNGSEKITIGGPYANTEFYVSDKFGNILPPYACGELIICGELVGRGYMKLPEKTKEAFFTLRGRPAYHSGDMVRLNDDGEVEFFGRKDNQIKLRGFRIELDEIEKCMGTYEGITQSKVIVRNNGSEDFLAGFFTAERTVDIARLSEYMKTKLAHYMVPDAMMQLDAMPLTMSGKIDKKALPEIKKKNKKSGRKPPKKSLEEQLCDLFKSVLSLDEYYADDDFFEMGGTSLSASKAVMQLLSKGFRLEYQDIFSNPTPEQLAEYMEAQQLHAAESAGSGSQTAQAKSLEVLKYNSIEFAAEVEREPLGDVLLTGAVGFLGIHILRELIRANEGRIICLLRKGRAKSAEARIKNMLMYYFDSTFDEEFADRISVIDADITDDAICDILETVRFDTLINCAACVKHYAADDTMEKINVHGVENLIRSAKAKNVRMIQISTTSIPGIHTAESWRLRVKIHENELFVIDDMQNKYCISKYRAEMKMFEAIQSGMHGKVIRVGNLMGRYSDGEFQINFNTNAFLNALRGFATIGKCPISHATDPMSFSPIDKTAEAIVLLAGTNDKFTVFHADSRFGFDEMQLIEAANSCGITITPVPDKEYYADFYRMLGNEKLNARLQGLITNDRPELHAVAADNNFTANVLYRLGFSWPLAEKAYLNRVINSLRTLGFFEFGDENY